MLGFRVKHSHRDFSEGQSQPRTKQGSGTAGQESDRGLSLWLSTEEETRLKPKSSGERRHSFLLSYIQRQGTRYLTGFLAVVTEGRRRVMRPQEGSSPRWAGRASRHSGNLAQPQCWGHGWLSRRLAACLFQTESLDTMPHWRPMLPS